IRRLVGHKRILPYLIEMLGPSPRLDHQFAFLARAVSASWPLHGGATPHSAYAYYNFKDQRFFCGLLVASFALTDTPPGVGGFCCIPGSHKSNFSLPEELTNLDDPDECIVQLSVRKGDVILFPEALTHGTLKWTGDHERRAVLFKYAPRHIVWESEAPFVTYNYDWEEHQKELLRGPNLRAKP
ncbi:MAG TPA: phytanoyl-CoA dioxygenase family protein, partial [Blastocatellia bacterium]